MQITELCKKCCVTKKAVEYYCKKGLLQPRILENGYRVFSDEDERTLNKIHTLRKLGFSVCEIDTILKENEKAALKTLTAKKEIEFQMQQNKQDVLKQLVQTGDWEKASFQLRLIETRQTLSERLQQAFPGIFGVYLCAHFGPYLQTAIQTPEQEKAFKTLVDWLDSIQLDLPDEMAEYLESLSTFYNINMVQPTANALAEAVEDPRKYFEEHRQEMEAYRAAKQTDTYKMSPAYQLENALKTFMADSGYNDIFIPAMCSLSAAYRDYRQKLLEANAKFLQMYPQSESGKK